MQQWSYFRCDFGTNILLIDLLFVKGIIRSEKTFRERSDHWKKKKKNKQKTIRSKTYASMNWTLEHVCWEFHLRIEKGYGSMNNIEKNYVTILEGITKYRGSYLNILLNCITMEKHATDIDQYFYIWSVRKFIIFLCSSQSKLFV